MDSIPNDDSDVKPPENKNDFATDSSTTDGAQVSADQYPTPAEISTLSVSPPVCSPSSRVGDKIHIRGYGTAVLHEMRHFKRPDPLAVYDPLMDVFLERRLLRNGVPVLTPTPAPTSAFPNFPAPHLPLDQTRFTGVSVFATEPIPAPGPVHVATAIPLIHRMSEHQIIFTALNPTVPHQQQHFHHASTSVCQCKNQAVAVSATGLDPDEVTTIVNQANVSHAAACRSLRFHGNIVDAILCLTP